MTTARRITGALALMLGALAASIAATGCTLDRSEASVSNVTIDMRCASTADCPSGFACNADVEHGPPTTMCESSDPAATCPAGFDIKVIYGQTVCKPRAPATAPGARASHAPTAGHHHSGM